MTCNHGRNFVNIKYNISLTGWTLVAVCVFCVPITAETANPSAPADNKTIATSTSQEDEPNYDEELTVTATRLEKGAVPSAEIMSSTYDDRARGWRLYSEGKFREALPYLERSAKRGFKWPQALTGDIYLNGRGGVPRNIPIGIAWIGTAAMPTADSTMLKYYRNSRKKIPDEYVDFVDEVVTLFRTEYGSKGHRVSCVRRANNRRGGYSGSLRMRRVACSFMDEVPICRNGFTTVINDGSDGDLARAWRDDWTDTNMQWTCPKIRK